MAPILPWALFAVERRGRDGKVSSLHWGRRSAGMNHGDSQTQLFGRLRLVITRTLFAFLAMGMAQQTTRGVDRPLLLIAAMRVLDEEVVVAGMETWRRRTKREPKGTRRRGRRWMRRQGGPGRKEKGVGAHTAGGRHTTWVAVVNYGGAAGVAYEEHRRRVSSTLRWLTAQRQPRLLGLARPIAVRTFAGQQPAAPRPSSASPQVLAVRAPPDARYPHISRRVLAS